jgi:hypothetical protein
MHRREPHDAAAPRQERVYDDTKDGGLVVKSAALSRWASAEAVTPVCATCAYDTVMATASP